MQAFVDAEGAISVCGEYSGHAAFLQNSPLKRN